jgi:hypothetical protein
MSWWATSVYVLCLAASAVCAVLLVRSYLLSRNRLLLWSAICFVCLALNNLAVVLDIIYLTEADLALLRIVASLVGVTALLYGFIFEVDE